MYRKTSTPCLDVSPAKVVIAISFQSVMTVGSSDVVVTAIGAAPAVPASEATNTATSPAEGRVPARSRLLLPSIWQSKPYCRIQRHRDSLRELLTPVT
jgi:hypothetical protein